MTLVKNLVGKYDEADQQREEYVPREKACTLCVTLKDTSPAFVPLPDSCLS